jgi:t-SNARE complex subunit (syntaxin)
MVRYKEYVKKMIEENQGLFDEFRIIHDKYSQDNEKYQSELNRTGEKVQEVVKEYENRVCANTERSFSQYSANLAEKFQNEIRNIFPMIDFIGVKVTTTRAVKHSDSFVLKKLL